MIRLEDLTPNASLRGVLPSGLVTVVSVQWFGSEAVELTYKDATGKVANELLYRHDEPRLEIVEQGRPWSFDGDGELFRLVSEAQRIHLAHIFDPVLAVHTSVVDPLRIRSRPFTKTRCSQALRAVSTAKKLRRLFNLAFDFASIFVGEHWFAEMRMRRILEELLTQKRLAKNLDKSERTLERWRVEGTGPAFVKAGRKVLYDP